MNKQDKLALIDIIEDQAFAMTKLAEMLRNEINKVAFKGTNLKISGDTLSIDGNVALKGDSEIIVKNLIVSGELDLKEANAVSLDNALELSLSEVKNKKNKVLKKNRLKERVKK